MYSYRNYICVNNLKGKKVKKKKILGNVLSQELLILRCVSCVCKKVLKDIFELIFKTCKGVLTGSSKIIVQ